MNSALLLCALFSSSASVGQDSVPLVGLVEDEQGSPVEGAEIWVMGVQYPQPQQLARAKTDRGGRFRVEIPAAAKSSLYGGHVVVWARSAPGRLAWQSLNLAELPAEPVRLVAGERSETTLTVVNPDGIPVAGATVRAVNVQRGTQETQLAYAVVPEELSIELAAKTDDAGVAKLPDFAAEELAGVRVETDGFGVQQFGRRDQNSKLQKLTLAGVGRLVGRLTGGDAKAAAGTTFDITSTRADAAAADSAAVLGSGFARVQLDESGRFELPAIAAGKLHFQISSPKESAYRAQPPTELVVAEGEETQVEIPLKRAARVRGVVRERETKRPIAGVQVNVVSNNSTNEILETTEDGTYAGFITPGKVMVYVASAPKSFITQWTPFGMREINVESTDQDHEFSPIELVRGATLRGRVVDDGGRSVADATVTAQWTMHEGNLGSPKVARATSNQDGEFVLDGVDPNGEMQLSASHRDASTAEPVAARAEGKEPVVLRVSASVNVAATGRVVDRAGKAVAGATIEVWSQQRAPEGNVISSGVVQFDGQRSLKTDEQGKFQTPRRLKRGGEYRALVRAAGMLPGSTEWLKLTDGGTASFPDIVLGRLRSVEGRVVDTDGQPVTGATVIQSGDGPQRTQARTDDAGRFRLDGLADGPAFVFVEKSGFRFHGQPVEPSQSSIDLEIRRTGQPSGRSLDTLAGILSREESLQLARQVLEPLAGRAIAEGEESDKLRTLEVLARVDPARVLDEIEKKGFPNPWFNDYLRRAVIGAMVKDSLDEALAIVESMQDPSWRATGLTDAADALPESERGRKLELLSQALLHARNVQDPGHRLHHMGGIAERWLDMGEVERATQLLREGEKVARELPQAAFAGYARGAFAEELAQIDLAAALELTKDLSDKFEYDRHHGNIAHELGGKNPAEAERILSIMRDQYQRDQWSPRVCYRMATVDLKRARAIADKISRPELKAYTYGVMAEAWAGRDKPQATELLREAFDQLQQFVASGKDRFNGLHSAVGVGAALLPVAELIDPELVPEFLWQAISFRLPRPQEHEMPGAIEQTDASLALMLARYDRQLARTIFDPVAEKIRSLAKSGSQVGRGFGTFFATASVIDPRGAVELLDRLPDDPGLAFHTPKNSARLAIAGTLALRDHDRWRSLARYFVLWTVDTEDH